MVLGSVAHRGSDPIRGPAAGHAAAVPHGLKLNQLRYVLSAAEQGSFRRAAAALNIQQSTISRRIRELEDRLGAALFERDAAGVRLTRTGGQFLARARRAVEHLAEATEVVRTAGRAERAVLRVGVVQPLGQGFLGALLASVVAQKPACGLVIREGPSEAHLAALATRRLDIAFLPEGAQGAGLMSRALWREPLTVVLRADHRLAARPVLTAGDLEGQAVLIADDAFGREIAGVLAPAKATVPADAPPQHAASVDTLLRLAVLGQGLVVLGAAQANALDEVLVSRRLADLEFAFCAVWSGRNDKLALRRALRLADELSGRPPSPAEDPVGRGRNRDRSP